jgi:hypothetical protein
MDRVPRHNGRFHVCLELAGDHRVHGQEELAACLGGLASPTADTAPGS